MEQEMELVPIHFPARRAAKVALHHLNTLHGSPFNVFGLQEVHKATMEEIDSGRRKYSLDLSVIEWASSNSVFRCLALVTFSLDLKTPPDVQIDCAELQQTMLSLQKDEDQGNMSEEMKPFWHLAAVASSFIMLKESSENTEFNMAQVASLNQQESREKKLMLKYHILLHDFVSQEILHWQLLCSWAPGQGVEILEAQFVPKCPHTNESADNTAAD
ncbi:hypothetical protein DNTS_031781 [Danionella cerebrum]|uniref:Cystatin LXN-type domain-containing protein n=2 Tax=Danionella cerebrum TaxID=2873325 RepID=A0A553MYS3_9TELE|nr:hypothetical protein DNTS_031781 [Danionella translucida]